MGKTQLHPTCSTKLPKQLLPNRNKLHNITVVVAVVGGLPNDVLQVEHVFPVIVPALVPLAAGMSGP